MKTKNTILLILILSLIVTLGFSSCAFAAVATENGLQAELVTDKEVYSLGDSITCELKLLNNSEQELTVSYDIIVPDGLQLNGETAGQLTVPGNETAKASFAMQSISRGAESVPSTGDSFPAGLMIMLVVSSLILLFVLCLTKKRFLLFMLVFLMAFSVVQPFFVSPAVAEENTEAVEMVYEEDAYQEEFLNEPTEEEMEILWDEAELKALDSDEPMEFLSETMEEFSIHKDIIVDGKILPVTVNAVVASGYNMLTEATAKATLGSCKLKPITILGTTTFRLNWSKVSGATHYEVWHSSGKGYTKRITTTKLTYSTKYGTAGLINTFKVRAIRKVGNTTVASSPYSTRTCYGMKAPTINSAGHTSSQSTDVRIRWSAGSFCTGYYVYRSFTGASGSYTLIGKTTGLSFVDKYRNGYYKIRPYYSAKNGITYVGPASNMKNMPTQYRSLLIGQSYPTWAVSEQRIGCANDAKDMKKMLETMTSTRFRPVDNVLKLNLTASQILQQIKVAFQRAKANDVSVFFFSGHGAGNAPYGWLCGTSGYVEVNELRKALDAIPGKKIVLLQNCYSGTFIGKDLGIDASSDDTEIAQDFNDAVISAFSASDKANLAANNYYVMTACNGRQYSWTTWYDESYKDSGVFPRYLMRGSGFDYLSEKSHSMYADANGDKKITLKELYNYVYPKVLDYTTTYCDSKSYVQVYPSNSSQILWGR